MSIPAELALHALRTDWSTRDDPPPPGPASSDPDVCGHPRMPTVPFDEDAARGLSSHEVRRRWPRMKVMCPDCGFAPIAYASFIHYISGDW